MVPTNLRNKPGEVLAVVMYGAELGIGPMQALQQINFIEGKPSTSPELMRALIRKAGHRLSITQTNEECVIVGERGDNGESGETSFTITDAVQAGLCRIVDGRVQARSSSGHALPWEKYTRDMLLARATSRIARMMFSDVVAGMSYTPEEVESFTRRDDNDEGEKPKRSSSRRGTSKRQGTARSAPVVEGVQTLASKEAMKQIGESFRTLSDDEKAQIDVLWHDAGLTRNLDTWTSDNAATAMRVLMQFLNAEPANDGTAREDAQSDENRSTDVSQHESVKKSDEIKAPKMSKAQFGLLCGLLERVRGYVDQADRDRCVSVILGDNTTMDKLTKAQATKCIDQLKDEAGE